MNILKTIDDFESIIKNNNMVLIYISGEYCGVCKAVKPKVIEMLKSYPNIKAVEVEAGNTSEVSAQLKIFTIPSILLFIDGKEVIRELRFISILELEKKISRYYEMYYS